MTRKLNDKSLKIVSVLIDSIKKHPKNARLHDEENIQAVMRSLETFGQRTPLVVGTNNYILKGNGTHESALRLGWKTIQITRVLHLSPEAETAYALADNKTSDLSEFDFSSVAGIMHDLKEAGIDLSTTGFRDFEIEPLLEADFNPGEPGQLPEHPDEESLKIIFTGDEGKEVLELIEEVRGVGWTNPDWDDQKTVLEILRFFRKEPHNIPYKKKTIRKLGKKK